MCKILYSISSTIITNTCFYVYILFCIYSIYISFHASYLSVGIQPSWLQCPGWDSIEGFDHECLRYQCAQIFSIRFCVLMLLQVITDIHQDLSFKSWPQTGQEVIVLSMNSHKYYPCFQRCFLVWQYLCPLGQQSRISGVSGSIDNFIPCLKQSKPQRSSKVPCAKDTHCILFAV